MVVSTVCDCGYRMRLRDAVPGTLLQCPDCGGSLSVPMLIECPACRAVRPAGGTCPSCGAIDSEHCVRCGRRTAPYSAYCPDCGAGHARSRRWTPSWRLLSLSLVPAALATAAGAHLTASGSVGLVVALALLLLVGVLTAAIARPRWPWQAAWSLPALAIGIHGYTRVASPAHGGEILNVPAEIFALVAFVACTFLVAGYGLRRPVAWVLSWIVVPGLLTVLVASLTTFTAINPVAVGVAALVAVTLHLIALLLAHDEFDEA